MLSLTVFFFVITEVWSSSGSNGQCHTHDLCWRRGVDGILRGLFYSCLSYWNTGTSARNQCLIAVNAAEHWYTLASQSYEQQTPKCYISEKVPSQTLFQHHQFSFCWSHFCFCYVTMSGHQFKTHDTWYSCLVQLAPWVLLSGAWPE